MYGAAFAFVFPKGQGLPKDKKKKKKATRQTGRSLRALAQNALVADVVAAALVATATALKNPRKARQLALEAGDELGDLARAGAEEGHALWDLALQVGRRSLKALAGNTAAKVAKPKPRGKKRAATKSAPEKKNGKKRAARRSPVRAATQA